MNSSLHRWPRGRPDLPSTLDAPLAELVEQLAEEMVERWRAGECPRVEEFLERHPNVREIPQAALELIAEEMNLRSEAGEEPEASKLAERFPQWNQQVRALAACHRLLAMPRGQGAFPEVDECIGEFRLLAELGRGGHGRVFLASQTPLADRPVVLKLSASSGREHLSLSRLQHTHIVPLHSVHEFPERRLRGLCQPYFGGASLALLFGRLRAIPPAQRSGLDLLHALQEAQAAAPVSLPMTGPACQFLARASYVEAVCWIGACLADALQYAHERGLLHLDLKPSNVLLAADGQPMLLDFHLARAPLARGVPPPSSLGGTPGYMAPEQRAALRAVSGNQPLPASVEQRADLYGLGVLLYEALAGELPPAERPARALRRCNPNVTTGLADLLARCLASNPAQRYAGAADLAADLRRHLANLPLCGVANRNPVERGRKWLRRHPYWLPAVALLLATSVPVALLAAGGTRQARAAEAALQAGEEYLQQQRYAESADAFQCGTALAEDLPLQGELMRKLDEGKRRAVLGQAAGQLHALCERLRPLYGIDNLNRDQATAVCAPCRELWQRRGDIANRLTDRASPELERQVQTDLLDLAILWADLRVRLASEVDVRAARAEALAILGQAEALFGPSCVLCAERRIHALALGRREEARRAEEEGAALEPRNAWEHYALGRAYLEAGDLPRAARQLDLAVRMQPKALWPYFYRGVCAFRQREYQDAVVAFTACTALAPDSPVCLYNRGRAYGELGLKRHAREDFGHAVEIDRSFQPAVQALQAAD